MHVSADNVIRFPVMSPAMAPRVEARESAEPAENATKVLAFAPAPEQATLDERAQEHGQLFVAHRIVSRVAEGLDHVATL